MDKSPSSPGSVQSERGLLLGVYDLFSSVWYGITLMVLIFLYMTVASAGLLHPLNWSDPFGPWTRRVVRESLNLTEMEAFSWWPFTTLIALLVINMSVVTVRRIRLNTLNLGVWMIHTGIVILALGSVYYFSMKLEGDTPVFRRHIVLDVPGAANQEALIVRPDNRRMVMGAGGAYEFHIQSIDPSWPLLSGEDEGKTTCSVNVAVTTPTRSFIRQLLVGYPQYTEDIIPGQGRAIKAIGKKLIDEDLRLTLDYEPQTHFFVMDTAALYVREVGAKEWFERPIQGLPHYSDHIARRNEIWQPVDKPIEPDPLDILVPRVDPNDPLGNIELRVTGRLHYAPNDEAHWVGGGDQLNPILRLTLEHRGQTEEMELSAFGRATESDNQNLFRFRWADSDARREALAAEASGQLTISIPGTDATLTVPVNDDVANTPAAPPALTPIGESGWSYRITEGQRSLTLGNGETIAGVLVEFTSADKTFTRWVAEAPRWTRDIVNEDDTAEPDPAVAATYRSGPMVMIVAGPESSNIQVMTGGAERRAPVSIGQPFELGEGLTMTVTEIHRDARLERRPVVVPEIERNANAGAGLSRIKLLMSDGKWSTERWLRFNRYAFSSDQYAVPGRFSYDLTRLTLPNGRQVELLFSRQRWPLPAALALEDFELKTHAGGFVEGNTASVRDFISLVRAYRDGKWGDPFKVSLNKPGTDAGYYYFQSEWDPGQMAFTGLGVGTRDGVYIQLFGTCVSVAGMIYVFYVKPIIIRRRRKAVWSELAARPGSVEWSEAEAAGAVYATSASSPSVHRDVDQGVQS